jgi:hypothetical protein
LGILVAVFGKTLGFLPAGSPENPMYVLYEPVQVDGADNGYLYGYGFTQAWGGACYLLLTPKADIVRTQN